MELRPKSRRSRVMLNQASPSPVSSTAVRWATPSWPNLPVNLAPALGSTIRRVYTSVCGVPNSSMPSRKNGRFSGKKRAKRSFTVTCPSSLSTWLKSGLSGGVERVAGEAEPQVEPRVGIHVVAVEVAGQVVARPVGRGGDERLGLDGDAVPQIVQPADRALLPDEAGVGPAHVGPGVGVAGALHHAGDVEAPGLPLAAGIAQALERNPDLDLVAPLGDPALRVPDEVGILVDAARHQAAHLAGALAPHAVALHAERIDAEEEGAAAVVEGVEVEDDVVLVVDVVPVGDGGADGGRAPVVGDDAEVDRVGRIPHQDLGLLLRGAAVHRLVLPEAGEPRGLGPHRLVEHAVDPDRRFQPRDLGGGRALSLDDRAGGGGLEQQQSREHGPLWFECRFEPL